MTLILNDYCHSLILKRLYTLWISMNFLQFDGYLHSEVGAVI